MLTTNIECDNCQQNLSNASARPEYMLVLSAQRIPNDSTAAFDLLAIKPIDEDHHFCGIGCLGAWASKRKLYAS